MPNPCVSALLPTYEPNPEYLKEALTSLMSQTFQDWNLIIHDDASTVDVRAMLEPFLSDKRVTFKRSEKRLGIGGNWNACLKLAQGEFVQFLFQDDTWEPDYLEKAVKAMESDPSIGIVGVNHQYSFESIVGPQYWGPTENEGGGTSVSESGRRKIYTEVQTARSKLTKGRHSGSDFLLTWAESGLRPNIVGEPSFVMLRRSVTDRAGYFREDLPQGLDMEYWVRMLAVSDFSWVSERLGAFRVHGKAASAQNEERGAGLTDRLACFETLLRVLPGERAEVRRALVKALRAMRQKFHTRKEAGNLTGKMQKNLLVKFAIRHPVLICQSFL